MNKLKLGLGTLAILAILGSSVGIALATSNDWHTSVRNGTDTADVAINITAPTTGEPQLLTFNPTSGLPEWFDIVHPGLNFNSVHQLEIGHFSIDHVENLEALLAGKASTSTVNALSSSISASISTINTNITSVNSDVGFVYDYFSAQTPQRIRVQTNSSGTYTWTFPTPYDSVPVINVVAEDATSNVLTNAQVISVSTTTVVVQARRVSTILGILTLTTNPQVYVHITAMPQ